MFPEKIKELRAKKGLSQGDVARTLFVTQQAVSKWESGKGYPDLPTLQALAKLYGVPVDDLVGTEEYSEAKKIISAKISPVFAILLGVYVLAAILCAVFSGTLVQLYERTLGSDALSRALGLTALIAFFSSCLALVLFVLLSQSLRSFGSSAFANGMASSFACSSWFFSSLRKAWGPTKRAMRCIS